MPKVSPQALSRALPTKGVYCGALNRQGIPCTSVAGYETSHPGEGRCVLHEQRQDNVETPPMSAEAAAKLVVVPPPQPSKRRANMETFMGRVEAARNSDDLLTLDNEIAVLRVVIEDEISQYVDEKARWVAAMEALGRGEFDEDGSAPTLAMPSLPLETLNTMQRLIKIAYDMRFAKRFSIPISELENVVNQIRNAFVNMCQKYNIPDEAKLDFARELMSIKLSQKTDWQLARAGGEEVPQWAGSN